MNNIFHYIPGLSSFQIKHFDKTFYINKQRMIMMSSIVEENPKISSIVLPEIEGPSERLLRFLNGAKIEINDDNALFFIFMSEFLQLKDKSIQKVASRFLPTYPNVEFTLRVLDFQKKSNFTDDAQLLAFLPILDCATLEQHPEVILSPHILDLILANELDLCVGKNLVLRLMKMMMDNLKTNPEYEQCILKYINRYQSPSLYRMALECPYLDIRGIQHFNDILFDKSSKLQQNYFPFNPDLPLNGFFAKRPQSVSITLEAATHTPGHQIENILNYESNDYYCSSDVPIFSIYFENFSFKIDSYSLLIPDHDDTNYPFSWQLLGSLNGKDYYVIDEHVNDNICQDSKPHNFKIDLKLPTQDQITNNPNPNIKYLNEKMIQQFKQGIRSLIFVLNKSVNCKSQTELQCLSLKAFEIFGTARMMGFVRNFPTTFRGECDTKDIMSEIRSVQCPPPPTTITTPPPPPILAEPTPSISTFHSDSLDEYDDDDSYSYSNSSL
ncbi:hypothetical protein TRFO_08144 [Tritrichomonas foetus]|uniref:Uncharacterized protein n=1 Tax=Tritrichomonas foetus TaxID=1144522 RepID=A0A1J4JL68_9EUKA|nr:hypothetical protein TRFO_08144 [Tritrichomonas foetus]|eukprot:OHS99856.1 hypothetical protein TRFO_08144 [Tritrichomonas foetus]